MQAVMIIAQTDAIETVIQIGCLLRKLEGRGREEVVFGIPRLISGPRVSID
jgi:hypothetical protein